MAEINRPLTFGLTGIAQAGVEIDTQATIDYALDVEVHLTPEQHAFIDRAVSKGRFASAEDAVQEAVKLLEARELEQAPELDLTQMQAFVQKGLDDLEAGQYQDYSDDTLRELFDDINHRGRERLAAERSS